MGTIDDFGGPAQPLNAPALGGPAGWAAAVRDAVRSLEGTVLNNTNAIAQHASDIAANVAAIAGKVSKAGDTMTGALDFQTNGGEVRMSASPSDALQVLATDGVTLAELRLADGIYPDRAATKGYVDGRIQGGSATSASGGIAYVDFHWPFVTDPYSVIVVPIAGQTAVMATIRSVGPSAFGFSVVDTNDQYVVQNCYWIAIGPPT